LGVTNKLGELIEIRPNRKIHIDSYINSDNRGQKLFLIHGSSGSPEQWRTILPILRDNFDCIVPSLLGHGSSGAPLFDVDKYLEKSEDNPYDFIEIAKDLEVVLDKYGNQFGNNIIIGHSTGGLMGLYLAHKYPDIVKRLILLCPDTIEIERDLSELWRAPVEDLEAIRPQLEEAFQYMAFYAGTDKDLVAKEMAAAHKVPMYVVQGLKIGKHSMTELDFSNFMVPTVILAGDKDLIVPVSRIKSAYDNIKGIRIEVIAKAGHFIMLEEAKIVMDYIRKELSL
jgi:pimeloyl-ACP methyl ester carboxylesterase